MASWSRSTWQKRQNMHETSKNGRKESHYADKVLFTAVSREKMESLARERSE